jgi:hypothetical protein
VASALAVALGVCIVSVGRRISSVIFVSEPGAEPAPDVGYNESIVARATRRPTSGPLDGHLERPPHHGAETEGGG